MSKVVSIIIPAYNCEKYIQDCINSVLKQSYQYIEVIVVNDGSTDKTKQKLKKYNNNKLITIINQDNAGAPMARNMGIRFAKGDYAIFLDSDDWLEKNAISNIMNSIDDYDLVISQARILDIDGNISYFGPQKDKIISLKKEQKNLLQLMCESPNPANKLYNLRIIKENNIFFSDTRIGQDLEFYIRYLFHCNAIKYIKEITVNYRLLETGISKSYDERILDICKDYEICNNYYIHNGNTLYLDYLNIVFIRHFSYQALKIPKMKENKMIILHTLYEQIILSWRCINDKFNLNIILFFVKSIIKIFIVYLEIKTNILIIDI